MQVYLFSMMGTGRWIWHYGGIIKSWRLRWWMQNGYQGVTSKEVEPWLGQQICRRLLAVIPTPQSRAGRWLWRNRHYGAGLVQTVEQQVPARLRAAALRQVLQQLFGGAAQQGRLDFLIDRRLGIEVPDLQMHYVLGLNPQRRFWLADAAKAGSSDVQFRANSNELRLLLCQQADPDTLFFQRRLTITGDTELGLRLKNYLDTLEPALLLPAAVLNWLSWPDPSTE